ncbi:PAS domain-containing protein [Fibrobacter sp. UWEL]|uniref:PAS domain-containing protein n=1 Tax=Fibrobacter sp. UWEL TaxID=1896209 RepID=UPI00091C8E30|nr:PAS domain-containing protein [Fibrobacter sp. UWEL]SHK44477.1 PAS domain S-box-containing protein [Fibrobacter sp. UWEL]
MLNKLFKSIIDQDNANIVVCDLDHKIVYMNPIACERYAKRGGAALVSRSLMDCHNPDSQEKIRKVIAWFAESPSNNRVHTFFNDKQNKDGYMVALRDEDGTLIGYYEKHEYRDKDETPFYQL